ncbi:hypothetical protein CTheo_899 [Ceratobasidium theobromae]|uniref:Uncharacterized protein n=1 Tax=Ceratobasidium theobromae TaxID=1582974 RepID=A0A5N5QVQ4_9AGAM|nr:hypothetical protein CTheo_899 [Ceratobasidium theobromae]
MTAISITDDLPPQVQPSAPIYGTTTAAAVAAAFARTSMPPTPSEAPRKTPSSKNPNLFPPSVQEASSPALTPRKHRPQPIIDVENTLHYARRASHQRSASSSATSLLLSPSPAVHDHRHHDEKTLRAMRKQQRASLPAYFSLLSTPLVAQSEPRLEEWAAPQPQYRKAYDVPQPISVTPTVDLRERNRSRSRSRGRQLTRRSSHGAAQYEVAESVVQRGRSRIPRVC